MIVVVRHEEQPNLLVGFCQENTERLYFKKQRTQQSIQAKMLIENC